MNAVDQILELLSSQPRTRQELQQATGLKRSTIDSALKRLKLNHQIEVRPISVVYGGPGSHPGRSGRPKGATVAYCAGGEPVMRLNYSDEEDRPGQFALWDANCRRSLQGKAGQRALRELEAALLALPEKRLIKDLLVDNAGGVCAIACYGKHKGLDLSTFDPEDESDEVGIAAGMPRLVAWKVVALNDIVLDTVWEVADGPIQPGYGVYKGGIALVRDMTPEERYDKVLAWVRGQLTPAAYARVETP